MSRDLIIDLLNWMKSLLMFLIQREKKLSFNKLLLLVSVIERKKNRYERKSIELVRWGWEREMWFTARSIQKDLKIPVPAIGFALWLTLTLVLFTFFFSFLVAIKSNLIPLQLTMIKIKIWNIRNDLMRD